jgi:hypothetical protein
LSKKRTPAWAYCLGQKIIPWAEFHASQSACAY